MTTRILLTGILGAVAMFIWSAIAHMFTPLGEMGIRHDMPNESAVRSALESNLGENRGLYLFPGPEGGAHPTQAQQEEAMKKAANGPTGLLMYTPRRQFNMARLLGVEFAIELLEAILVVALLAQTRITSFGGRVMFVTVAGILAAIATNISYWNWYGFPKRYIAGYMFIQVVGFICVGLVAALVNRNKAIAPN